MAKILLKRTYDSASPSDGFRIFVDRLWPRGLSHETFHYDLWDKQLAPTDELREWFHVDPQTRWDGFRQRYEAELKANPAFAALKTIVAEHPVVTLLYSSHDELHNNAVVVADLLKQ